MNHEVSEFIRRWERTGDWKCELVGKKNTHNRLVRKTGEQVIIASTPSDYRWRKQATRDIRRIEEKYNMQLALVKAQEETMRRRTRVNMDVENGQKRWLDEEILWIGEQVEKLAGPALEEDMVSWAKYLQRSRRAICHRIHQLGLEGIIDPKKSRFVPVLSNERSQTLARRAELIDGEGKSYTPVRKEREYGGKEPVIIRNDRVAAEPVITPLQIAGDFRQVARLFNEGLIALVRAGGQVEVTVVVCEKTGAPQVKVKRRVEEEF